MTATLGYVLQETPPDAAQKELGAYTPLGRQLLYNRGITTKKDAEAFLYPNYEEHLHDPFLLTDMEKAVSRILFAIEKKEHIAIYSDYDCDGIPGGVVLHDFFTAIGYTHFENYIPHRHEEGYGLNSGALHKLSEKGASLVITIDCGIVDTNAVAEGNALGLDLIITDHHEPGETLPDAYAVVNPKRDNAYPFQGLCGAGVIFKVIQGVILRGKEQGIVDLNEGQEKWLLDLVGLATIADMVPLVDENRVLAHYGLHVLRKSRRPGIQQLLRLSGGSQQHLSEDDIGFTIGPRINAASRMDDPEDAFHMLATKDEVQAGMYVARLEKLNNERKGVVAAMTKEAKKKISQHEVLPNVLVLGNPKWRPSLTGLVANALAEEFKRSCYVWGRDGRGVFKGSCRAYGAESTLFLMEAARELFIEFGGHHKAGGFSIKESAIYEFDTKLCETHTRLNGDKEAETEPVLIDAEISLDDVDESLLRVLKQLSPFGVENHKPLFQFEKTVPRAISCFGKAKNHMKLLLDTKNGTLEAVAFFKTPEDFRLDETSRAPVTLIAHVEQAYFRGRATTRLRIVDIL